MNTSSLLKYLKPSFWRLLEPSQVLNNCFFLNTSSFLEYFKPSQILNQPSWILWDLLQAMPLKLFKSFKYYKVLHVLFLAFLNTSSLNEYLQSYFKPCLNIYKSLLALLNISSIIFSLSKNFRPYWMYLKPFLQHFFLLNRNFGLFFPCFYNYFNPTY